MSGTGEGDGIALVCDPEGVILDVLRDGLGLADRAAPGRLLGALVDESSLTKCLNFLRAVREGRAVFDWEINVPVGGHVTALYFAGGVTDTGLLILGSTTRAGASRFHDELLKINNDQVNALRSVMKDLALKTRPAQPEERANELYEEMTRLNNEIATAQRELAKKNAELARLNEQKNQFLGMAAHDLRNPLGVIMSFADYLLEDLREGLTDEQTEVITTIKSSSRFMLRLLNDLLDIARIESGKLDLEPRPTDLIALLKQDIALNDVLARAKDISALFTHDVGRLDVRLDPIKIEQVFNNLLSNAVKFSHPGHSVEVRVTPSGRNVVVSVRDEGQGIPKEEQDKLFQPFSRTSVKSTGGEKSTGLGLSIVKRIVEAHGGSIWLESAVGRGTVFYVALPIGEGHAGQEPADGSLHA